MCLTAYHVTRFNDTVSTAEMPHEALAYAIAKVHRVIDFSFLRKGIRNSFQIPL